MDRLLITGAHGQVGTYLTRLADAHGFVAIPLGSKDLDISDREAVARVIGAEKPDAVVNAAAYTAVDKAEGDEARTHAVNADGPANLAAACAGVPLLHFSTDYVFDGTGERPYREGDPTRPLGAYGRTKLAGEAAVRSAPLGTVMRTAWVYSDVGSNFLKTMIRVGRQRGALSVVSDQHGTPTHAGDIAEAALRIVRQQLEGREATAGLYHYTASGQTSWHGFAAAIFEALAAQTGERVALTAIPSSDYPTPAARPAYSVLDCALIEETFGVTRPDWHVPVAGTVEAVLKDDQ
ncbi:dTDP-4-dehydrorhamnose reductase [Parvularcula dongshanensis]|uniref:dTDP-4-dehydrorhamnose reductase n=1 Tax=Parvularcula dongshanensis TaxID=1173995 RepID=A0A840I0W1_9PROT|nr:dTDP-4-dehydrorhamnose reductase [Parvularcula dongshanensis]MBB4657842.1 dTDP-4-dehydrorhamnose reductase [Parvularcula dongshanensis]